MIGNFAQIHRLALVENSAVGAHTKIWQFASVIRGAEIGEDCNIGSNAIVDGAKIGNGCSIGHGCSINPGIFIGNRVFVGPNVTFCNDLWPRTEKDGFEIDRLLDGSLVTTIVNYRASIGAGAVVLPGVVIGPGAMIAAGARVDRQVPAWHLLKRDGSIERIDPARHGRRMRPAPNVNVA